MATMLLKGARMNVRRRGAMLLEVLLGMAILGLSISVFVMMYERAQLKAQSTEMMQEIAMVSALVNENYTPETISKVDDGGIISTKALKNDWYNTDTGELISPWKTEIIVGYDGGGKLVDMYVYDIPYDACVMTLSAASAMGSILEFVQVNYSAQLGNNPTHTSFTALSNYEYCEDSNLLIFALNVY